MLSYVKVFTVQIFCIVMCTILCTTVLGIHIEHDSVQLIIAGSGSDGAAALEHLSSENQIQTNSRDMDQLGQSSSGIQTESPISSQVQLGVTSIGSQITMSSTSTPTVSQVKRGGVGGSVSNVALSATARQPARNTSSVEVCE